MDVNHHNSKISKAGLFLHPRHPFLGATPDAMVCCDCHGQGILEVKCPFCLCEKDIIEASEDKSFCLVNAGGQLQLKKDHAYFYQVQLQLLLTGVKYCDFVVWRGGQENQSASEVFMERIEPDMNFLDKAVAKAQLFFVQGVLPELVGKWYSRPHSQTVPGASADSPPAAPCYCQNEAVASLIIECKSGVCKIKLFHLTCLGLKNPPKRKWLCPDCRTIQKSKQSNM